MSNVYRRKMYVHIYVYIYTHACIIYIYICGIIYVHVHIFQDFFKQTKEFLVALLELQGMIFDIHHSEGGGKV